jgi:hypothetical protein
LHRLVDPRKIVAADILPCTVLPLALYPKDYTSLSREDLQRSLGVKPMDKSSQYRGVSRKKGKWEAKVMLNRKWAYRGGSGHTDVPHFCLMGKRSNG